MLEITVDHCLTAARRWPRRFFDLVRADSDDRARDRLSIGTDVPLDLAYLDKVASIVNG